MQIDDMRSNVAQNMMEDVKRAAEILNVSKHALYRKIRNGEIPGYKFGRKVLVDLQEIKQSMRIK
jgi:excisionase family DNA binding protein